MFLVPQGSTVYATAEERRRVTFNLTSMHMCFMYGALLCTCVM